MKAPPPRSFAAASKKIQEIMSMGLVPLPDAKSYGGNGAPGRLLEHLLGIAENNRDSPDLLDWEVKFHGDGSSPITLFHKDPEPRGIMRTMVHEHGWPDAKKRISFRHTVYGETNRGFYVVNEADRVVVRHREKDTVTPYWTHTTLLNCCGGKLRRLILVDGVLETYPIRGVRYLSATAYWDFDIGNFCKALEQGKVAIDFDARTQQGAGSAIRNHGVKFRVKLGDLPSLYKFSAKIPNVKG